jgi:orotate phosphoribosyltransferase
MHAYQQRFIELSLRYKALRFGEFTLKSGRISPYFFNAGLFNDGQALKMLGECYAEAIVQSKLSFDTLFGPAYKGIPLVAATAIALETLFQRNVPYCFNRKEAKDHGEGGLIIGSPLKGDVLILDDVITAGTAMRESFQLIQHEKAVAKGVLVALDRQERGQGTLSAVNEIEHEFKIPVNAIITLEDILGFTASTPEFAEYHEPLLAYRRQYGIK